MVVLYHAGPGMGTEFSRTAGDHTFHFANEAGAEGFQFVDDEAGSTWDVTGRAVREPMAESSLGFVMSFISECHGWIGYHLKPPEATAVSGGHRMIPAAS